MRYFELKDVDIKKTDDVEFPTFDFCQGENSVSVNDYFALWDSDGSNMPEKLTSVKGILYATYESIDQETPTYLFIPVS